MDDRIPLPNLPAEVAKQTGGRTAPYRRFYNAALDARFPVERDNGRLYIRRSNMAAAANALGIELSQ
jgi:hypothetical protein